MVQRTGSALNRTRRGRVRIVEPDQTAIGGVVQRERIFESIGAFRRWFHALDLKLHPVFSRFVDDEDIAIQSKQVFRRRIVGRMASRHIVRLLLGDNDYNAGSGASTPLATGQALFVCG